MNSRKGMSQVLSLIVGASVLMMVGLSLTVITQGSITDLISGQDSQSCISTLQTQCQTTGSISNTPKSCSNVDLSKTDYRGGTCPDSDTSSDGPGGGVFGSPGE